MVQIIRRKQLYKKKTNFLKIILWIIHEKLAWLEVRNEENSNKRADQREGRYTPFTLRSLNLKLRE